jgi:hypothetical protein
VVPRKVEWICRRLTVVDAYGFCSGKILRFLETGLPKKRRIFGDDFREQARDMDICEVLCAPRSPWQRAYVERVIGSFVVRNKSALNNHPTIEEAEAATYVAERLRGCLPEKPRQVRSAIGMNNIQGAM